MAKLEAFYLANVVLYLKEWKTFKQLRLVSKNCTTSFDMLRINPTKINFGTNNLFEVFPNIQTFYGTLELFKEQTKLIDKNRLAWIDASKDICHLEPFKNDTFIFDKLVKIKINGYDFRFVHKMFYLRELYIHNFVNTDFSILKKLNFLRKVVVFNIYGEDKNFKILYEQIKNKSNIKLISVVYGLSSGIEEIDKNWFKVKLVANEKQLPRDIAIRLENNKINQIGNINCLSFYDVINKMKENSSYKQLNLNIEFACFDLDLSPYECLELSICAKSGKCNICLPKNNYTLKIKTVNAKFFMDNEDLKKLKHFELEGDANTENGNLVFGSELTYLKMHTKNDINISIDLSQCIKLESVMIDASFTTINLSMKNKVSLKKVNINGQNNSNKIDFIGTETTNKIEKDIKCSLKVMGLINELIGIYAFKEVIIDGCINKISFDNTIGLNSLKCITTNQTPTITFKHFFTEDVTHLNIPIFYCNTIQLKGNFKIPRIMIPTEGNYTFNILNGNMKIYFLPIPNYYPIAYNHALKEITYSCYRNNSQPINVDDKFNVYPLVNKVGNDIKKQLTISSNNPKKPILYRYVYEEQTEIVSWKEVKSIGVYQQKYK